MKRLRLIVLFGIVSFGLFVAPVKAQGALHSNTLTWTLSSTSGVTSQKIYRGTVNGGPYTLLATIPNGTVVTYVDTNTIQGTLHYYVVTALVGTNESVNSNQVSALDSGTNVNPQTGLTVTVQ